MPSVPEGPLASRALRRVGASLCGRYRLRALIGVGGMAAVYAGVHRNGHAVAIKILHDRLSADPEIERLFRREALLANKINHPGVVPVIDDDVSEDGCIFLVMPLLDGETLRARAERLGGKLPVAEVVVVAHAMLEALAAAHTQKIVHRDIKPENVFLTREGQTRILDFGIGRFFESADPASATRSGRAVGTPAFMAPEQALGRLREIDGRTDIWAVGATMYTLLSGRFVHEGPSGNEILVLSATRPAGPLAEASSSVPARVRDVVDRALLFDRIARWQDAASMARALEEASQASLGVDISDLPELSFPPAKATPDVDRSRPPLAGFALAETDGALPEPGGDTAAGQAFRLAPTRTQPFSPRTPTERITDGIGTRSPSVAVKTTSRSKRLGPRSGLVVIASSAALLVAGLGIRSRLPPPTAPSPALADAALVDTAALDRESVLSCAQGARADLAAGIQLWRDASQWESLPHFDAAVTADPACAAASVYYLLGATHTLPRRREHFRLAREHRSTMPPRLQAVLDALAPGVSDPPNNEEARRRAESLLRTAPLDPDAQRLFVRSLYNLDLFAEATGTADRILGRSSVHDPSIEFTAGLSYLRSADSDNALIRFDRCLQLSPDSADCLLWKSIAVACDGNCAEAEASLRHLVSVVPHGPDGWSLLGEVLLADTGDSRVARSAFEQRWRNLSESAFGEAPNAAVARLMDEYRMAIFDGDLRSAQLINENWIAAVGTEPGRFRADALIAEIDLLRELGDTELARARSLEALRESRTWPDDAIVDYEIVLARLAYLTRGLSVVQFERARDAWVEHRKPKDPLRWLEGYADLPGLRRTMPPPMKPGELVDHSSWSPVEYYGRAAVELLHLNRIDDAVLHAHEAAKMCVALNALSLLRARLSLARAFEASGRAQEACSLYEKLQQTLEPTPSSVTGRYSAEHSARLHCLQLSPAPSR